VAIPLIILFCQVSLAEDCGKQALAAIVGKTSDQLIATNTKKTAEFQKKLFMLKKLNGWNDKDLISKAEPLVKNRQVAEFDKNNEKILAEISGLGQKSEPEQCAMRDRLSELLRKLSNNNETKWAHIMNSIDAALSKIRSASRNAK
jgi:hypothetical protein